MTETPPLMKKCLLKLHRLLCCLGSSSPDPSPFSAHTTALPSFRALANDSCNANSDAQSSKARPYFIPFQCPWLPTKTPYDHHSEGFWDFPERTGWVLDGKGEHRQFPQATDLAGDWMIGLKELDEALKCRQRSMSTTVIVKRPSDSLSLKCFRVDGSQTSLSEEVAFLQAWLFFGVLAEVSTITGVMVDVESEFVVRPQADRDSKSISTSALDGLLQQWIAAFNGLGKADQAEKWKRMLQIVQHVMSLQTIVSTLKTKEKDPRMLTYDECKVLLSIHILFRAVLLTLASISPPESHHLAEIKPFIHPILVQSFPANWDELKDFATKEMLAKGWCRSECTLLEPYHGFYNFFATRLSSGRWTMSHANCTEWMCVADQVDEKVYKTVHVKEDCRCEMVKVEPEELCKVLDQEKVPRINVSKDFKLVVSSSEPYVAISHVWSHGLGNAKENALPLCQVQCLARYLSGLQKAGETSQALWIDTLCIPVQENLKDYRKKAIKLMSKTYKDASVVLVLDRELQKLDSQRVCALEQDILTAFIGWTRRLWTLQEAALANRLYVQTLLEPQKINRLYAQTLLEPLDAESSEVLEADDDQGRLVSQICFQNDIRSFIRNRIPPIDTLKNSVLETSGTVSATTTALQRLSFAVKHRSTSKMEDEAIILAITMDFTVTEVLDAEDQGARMAKFLVMIHDLPSDIIFGDWEKIESAPYRWAPQSLLSFPIFKLNSFGPSVICDSHGLHGQYQGFLINDLGADQGATGKYYAIDEDSGMKYEFKLRGNSSQMNFPENPALIFRPLFVRGDTALVNIQGKFCDDGRDVLEVSIVGYLQLVASGNLEFGNVTPMKGSLTADHQRWCIT